MPARINNPRTLRQKRRLAASEFLRLQQRDRRMALLATEFTPVSLFASGEQGAWYDPSDLTTLYQDSAGTLPVQNDGDPVGLMLDKSQGLVLGPDVVTNGGFDTDTDWDKGTGWTISGGVASFSNSTGTTFKQDKSFEAGRSYEVSFDMAYSSGSGVIASLAGGGIDSGPQINSSGRHIIIITATAARTSLQFTGLGGSVFSIDNVTVKELPGNHATQDTGAAKRLYRTDGTLHWLEDDLFDDALNVTMPDLGTNATLAYADGAGVTILTGQTISGAITLPAVAQTYGVNYLDRPFTADETTQVTDYLNALRGA